MVIFGQFFFLYRACFCIYWLFLGLNHIHNLQLCEPAKKIWLIWLNNFFSKLSFFVRFGYFFDLYGARFGCKGLTFCSFWAAAPKGTKSCRTQGDFRSCVRSCVRSSIRPFVPPRPSQPWNLPSQAWNLPSQAWNLPSQALNLPSKI